MRYSEKKVGKNAGVIWNSLQKEPSQTISSLEKTTKLKKDDLLLAIGWLLKEQKLDANKDGRAINISLR